MNRRFIGFTLIELLIVVVIIGILASIGVVNVLNATIKAKDAAVKSNLAIAATALELSITINEKTTNEATTDIVIELNNPDGQASTGDETKSPYDANLDAYLEGSTGEKGQIAIEAIDINQILLKGYGKNGSSDSPIIVKYVKSFSVN